MLGVAQALELLLGEAEAGALEEVELGAARGRVLGERVVADRDFPPTDRSAMDGFAVRAADLAEPGRTLRLAGEIRAGQPPGTVRVGPGETLRIMTGAILPPGADAVVMVEQTEERPGEGRVAFHAAAEPGQHVRRRGEELRRGQVVLEPGRPLDPPEIAALASVGRTRIRVFERPAIHLLSTGDEVVEPEIEPLEHQVRNSNARALEAQLGELGLEAVYLGIAGDEPGVLDRRLSRGLAGDLLLITGGVSVGAYDLVGAALERAGMRLLFHRVAVKPGMPLLAGRVGRCLVLGLPGNPVSTYTVFAIFVAPLLRRMTGHREWRNASIEARLERPLTVRPGRETYHLARLAAAPGGLVATPVASAGSGDVLALTRANGFVVTGPDCAGLDAGARVPALLWRDFHLR